MTGMGTLGEEQVEEFKKRGVIVVKNVYSKEEVEAIRREMHQHLQSSVGLDVDDLPGTASSLSKLSSTAGAGGILDVFYASWKLKINEDMRLFSLASELWRRTYAENSPPFQHPFGDFDPGKGYMYIDRIGFRVPDSISALHTVKKKKGLQRSLTPHLDCCPHKLYDNINKWRPIQMFLALTDTLEPNQGGFEACHSLHSEFDEWVRNRAGSNNSTDESLSSTRTGEDSLMDQAPCVGSFTPIRPGADADILRRMEHIPCEAGDIVCWDYRIPHSNSRYNETKRAREVLYLGFLPATELNKTYAQRQLQSFRCGDVPTDQWHAHSERQDCSFQFSPLGSKLMSITPWTSQTNSTETTGYL